MERGYKKEVIILNRMGGHWSTHQPQKNQCETYVLQPQVLTSSLGFQHNDTWGQMNIT